MVYVARQLVLLSLLLATKRKDSKDSWMPFVLLTLKSTLVCVSS